MTDTDLWRFLQKNKTAIISLREAIDFVNEFYHRSGYHFFLNKKKNKKIKEILKNNTSKNKKIEIRFKKKILPFYKGDYEYFCCNYGATGLSRLRIYRYYLNVLEN